MTSSNLAQVPPETKIDPEPMIASLGDLVRLPTLTDQERKTMGMAISNLSQPASTKWIAGRAATTLAQYFTSPMPDKVMAAIAKDWAAELGQYPEWALQRAFRWWIGRENEKRRNKPVPGDISDRAHTEMAIVRAAQIRLRMNGPTYDQSNVKAHTPTDAERANVAKMVADAGFAPKRMGDA